MSWLVLDWDKKVFLTKILAGTWLGQKKSSWLALRDVLSSSWVQVQVPLTVKVRKLCIDQGNFFVSVNYSVHSHSSQSYTPYIYFADIVTSMSHTTNAVVFKELSAQTQASDFFDLNGQQTQNKNGWRNSSTQVPELQVRVHWLYLKFVLQYKYKYYTSARTSRVNINTSKRQHTNLNND